MLRIPDLVFAVVLTVGCSRPGPAVDLLPESAPPSSSNPSPSVASSPGSSGPIGFGASASGATHGSVQVRATRAEDNASVKALGAPVPGKLIACYKASPHYAGLSRAVRVALHVTVSTTGTVTTTGTAVDGLLVDKGHGERGYDFPGDPSTKDAALLACIDEAVRSADFPAVSRGTTFEVTIELSP
jgi:hypothetical protein